MIFEQPDPSQLEQLVQLWKEAFGNMTASGNCFWKQDICRSTAAALQKMGSPWRGFTGSTAAAAMIKSPMSMLWSQIPGTGAEASAGS